MCGPAPYTDMLGCEAASPTAAARKLLLGGDTVVISGAGAEPRSHFSGAEFYLQPFGWRQRSQCIQADVSLGLALSHCANLRHLFFCSEHEADWEKPKRFSDICWVAGGAGEWCRWDKKGY